MQRKTKPKKTYAAYENKKEKTPRKTVSRNNQKVAMRLEYLKW